MKSVLVVEDDAEAARSLKRILVSSGYSVRVAGTSSEAERSLEEHFPDAILLDVILPGEHGTAFLKRLKKSKRFSQVPVIAVTSVSKLVGVEKDLKGIDATVGFIEKPFTAGDILSELKKRLE
ncbi:MAG: response regulator [Candidatus Diapherotrites archaeon]|nr:response regulator [Candidatus Diapherotrites archaeon]